MKIIEYIGSVFVVSSVLFFNFMGMSLLVYLITLQVAGGIIYIIIMFFVLINSSIYKLFKDSLSTVFGGDI